ncbi:hypothetical protein [Nocardia sp. IFM 10818]
MRETDYSAPLAGTATGVLRFGRGVVHVAILADANLSGLFRARFDGPPPVVAATGNAIAVDYKGFQLFPWRKRAADIALNPAIPWRIEIGHGVSGMTADLRPLRVTEITVNGGAGNVDLLLGRPQGTVPVRFGAGVSRVGITRPRDVGVLAVVRGGASRFRLDDQKFGALGGETRLESPDYAAAADRYDIEIGGGASRLTIDRN